MGIKRKIISIFSLGLAFCLPIQANDLLETYEQAFNNSPELKYNYATYQSENSDSNIALGTLLPNVSFVGQLKSTNFYDSESVFNGITNSQVYSLSLSQTIFDYTLINIYRSTNKSSLSAYSTYEYQVQQFILSVSEAYFTVLLAESNVKVAQEQLKATGATLKQTKLQKQVGTKTESDVKQIEASYYSAEATLVKNINDLKTSYYELSVYTGVEKNVRLESLEDNMPVPPPAPSNMQKWVDTAIESNLNLQSVLYSQTASEVAVEACKGKFLPSVSLSASYGYFVNPFFQPGFGSAGSTSSTGSGGLINSSISTSCLTSTSNQISAGDGGVQGIPARNSSFYTGSIGVTFTWSIFNGGTDYAALEQGAQDYQNALYTTVQTQRDLVLKTEQDYMSVLTAISSVKAYRQAKIASDIAYKMMLDQYNVGTITINEVLQQMQITYKNSYDVAQAQFDYITNMLNLKLDAGALSRHDLEQINRLLKKS